jgi:membrane protein involved in colicin uptake
MVEKKLIQDTIIELLDANVDKESIISTLKDIGVDEGEINQNYNEIINSRKSKSEDKEEKTKESTQEEENKESTQEEEENKESTQEEEENKESTQEEEKNKESIQEEENKENTNEINIEDKHEKELKETADDVDNINKDFEKTQKNNLNSKDISFEISKNSEDIKYIHEQLSDLKAQVSALTKITKDVLSTTRDILNKL